MATAHTTEADKARAIRDAAGELHISLHLSGNTWNRAQQDYLFKLCNAIIDMIDDGDCIAQREVLMGELGCDEDGNPVPPESDLCTIPRGYALRAALNPISTNGGL